MGLTIYYAPAEIKPDTYIEKLLEQNAGILIVPEQYTLYAEKKYIKYYDSYILSFRRFAYRVFQQFGRKGEHINEHQKTMLLSYALKKVHKNLSIYKNASANVEFTNTIKGTINEFKNAKMSWQDIDNINVSFKKSLEYKLSDIAAIYKELDHIMGGKYYDSYDDYDEFTELLVTYREDLIKKYGDKILIIDKFAGFTKQEQGIIKSLIPIFSKTYLFLCADTLDYDNCPVQFSDTVKNVIQLTAEQQNVKKIRMDGDIKFKNDDLLYVCQNLFDVNPEPYLKKAEKITLYEANDRRAECEFVAKQVYRLVKDEHLKLSDIAVCARNITDYESIFKSVFAEFKMPVFMDSKTNLLFHSVPSFLFSIDAIFEENYSSNAVFQFLKSEFSPVDNTDEFENFCISYGVYGTHLKDDTKFSKKLALAEANGLNSSLFFEIRNRFVPHLKGFREKTKNVQMPILLAEEFYKLLELFGLGSKIGKTVDTLKEKGELRLANEYAQSFNLILSLVNSLIETFEGTPVSFHDFNKILKAGMGDISIGSIPPNLDSLIFSDAERLVDNDYKVLFVLGMNEGIFPKAVTSNVILNDSELEILEDMGIHCVMSSITKGLIEEQTVYKTLCMPSEKLFLSLSLTGGNGEMLDASRLFKKAKKLFPNVNQIEDHMLSSKQYTFRKILENGKDLYPELLAYFKQEEQYQNILQNIEFIKDREQNRGILSKPTVDKLYGDEMNISVSKMENYAACPFSYHLNYKLRLKERRAYSLSPLDAGSFIHNALEQFFINAKKNVKELDDPQIKTIVNNVTDDLLKRDLKGFFAASKRNVYLGNKLKNLLFHTARAIVRQMQDSDFEIFGCELTFDKNGDFMPMILNVNGKKILVQGKIDRCDKMDHYIRIVDYKSSDKDLKLDEVYHGLSLQLPLYLDVACENLKSNPSAMLYMHTYLPEIKLANLDEDIEEKIYKQYKMNGFVLGDKDVILAMDHSETSLPASITKSGFRGSFLTEHEFHLLRSHVKKILNKIAKNIINGKIDISPVATNGRLSCTYCPYKTICHFDINENKQDCRFMKNLSKEEIFQNIKKERVD